jgi:hypothetical protein
MYVSLVILGVVAYSHSTSYATTNGAELLSSETSIASVAADSSSTAVLFCSSPGGGQSDEHTSDFGEIRVERCPPVLFQTSNYYAFEFAKTLRRRFSDGSINLIVADDSNHILVFRATPFHLLKLHLMLKELENEIPRGFRLGPKRG